jgi:hypothetical protein
MITWSAAAVGALSAAGASVIDVSAMAADSTTGSHRHDGDNFLQILDIEPLSLFEGAGRVSRTNRSRGEWDNSAVGSVIQGGSILPTGATYDRTNNPYRLPRNGSGVRAPAGDAPEIRRERSAVPAP